MNNKISIRNFASLLKSRVPWLWYLINLVLMAVQARVALLIPQLTGDIMMSKSGHLDVHSAVLYISVQLFTLMFSAIVSFSDTLAGLATQRNIQHDIWRKLLRLPMKDYEKIEPSSLISRITSDPLQLTAFLTAMIVFLSELYASILIIVDIFSMSSLLAKLYLLVIPYVILVMIIPGRIMSKTRKNMQDTLSRFTTFVTERMTNIRMVKFEGMTENEEIMGLAAAEENYRAEVKNAIVEAAVVPFSNFSQAALGAIALIGGSWLISKGELDQGSLITMYLYSSNLFLNFFALIQIYHSFKQAQGATSVISELLETEEEDFESGVSLTTPGEDIVFDNVSFAYGDRKILDQVSVVIPHGKTTAIIGPSGSGKTTMLNLIERIYTPKEGKLCYGDMAADEINLKEWRATFGYLQQSSPLISGTIRRNIEYGLNRPAVSGEAEKAAERARASAFLSELEHGLDTDAGSLGSRLSGGERQKIALARTIIRDPDVMILDEAMSALDAENKAEVGKAIADVCKEKTTIIVTHDIPSIVDADNIIVMDHGQVVGCGTHEKLYRECKLYKTYLEIQED